MHLERLGLDATEPAVVLACLPDARRFVTAVDQRLASAGMFTAVFSTDLPALPRADVRGSCLRPDDPLAREWSVIVIGPHFAGALLARRRDAHGPDEVYTTSRTRGYDYVISHDRDVVISAARPLLDRLQPL